MGVKSKSTYTSKQGYPEGPGSKFAFSSPMATGSASEAYPSHYSTEGCGGLVEVADLESRNAIPGNETSGQEMGNIMTSGRRSVGMVVHVISEGKLYKLIPQGYWGNGGNAAHTEWAALGGGQTEDGHI